MEPDATSPAWPLCPVDILAEGRGMPARAGDRYVAVFLHRGEVHVFDNQCLHVGSPLDAGAVDEAGCLTCPWHGWRYDVGTGELVTAFGRRPGVRRHPAWVEAGMVWATVDG